MSSSYQTEETIKFPHDDPIVINYKSAVSYVNKSAYDRAQMTQGFVWHMILAHHRGKYSKRAILEAVFQAIGDEEFFPMVYKEGPTIDRFLVRQCQAALDKLFLKNLHLVMPSGSTIRLEVILNVGTYKFGQISPTRRIEKALDGLFKKIEDDGILNLNEFAKNPEFGDIVINLRNKAVFETVCRSVFRNEEQFRRVKGLRLRNNRIMTLQPMKVFNGCEFDILDLSSNLLTSSSRICKELKEIKMTELLLVNNPVTEGDDYPLNMKNIFSNFEKLDGKTIEELRTMPVPSERDDEDMSGKLIDPLKPHRMNKFKYSDDWHSITIPNRGKHTKQEILNVFYDVFPPEIREIYPCHYKEDEKEHSFYVRECFDQLKYLVEECKLRIPSPNPNAPKIHIQLRMKDKNFEVDPMDVVKTIGKAIAQRFNEKDRILDLEDLNSASGVESIEVNLRLPKVVNRVMTQAGNRFSKNIFELRLGRNGIESCNFAKPFVQMFHMRVLDLSHNNLKDFSDFMELEKLPIKSLNLNGNPLCDLYTYAPDYIKAAKAMFPDLTKLDNIDLGSLKPLAPKKNFLCNLDGYDFVQQFIDHYFTLFESDDRLSLKEMYHPKAILSLTCHYSLSNLSVQSTKRIARYTNLSRNILKISDFSRAMASLHSGSDEICQALAAIPNVQHDFVGFTTDTTIFNDKMVVITVSGVLKDVAPSALDPDLTMAFSRTFVLVPITKNMGFLKCATEYQIINDLFSVTNPSDWQMQNSFKFMRNPRKNNKEVKPSAIDKEGLLIMFQEVTMLKTIWCKRLLDEGNWDFKRSLEIFIEEGQKNQIPPTAFN